MTKNAHKPHWLRGPHGPYGASLSFILCHLLFIISLSIGLLSCSEAEQTYSRHVARFAFQNAQLVPQLNAALHNPGEFCTITPQNNQYVFSSPGIREDYAYNRTEQDVKAGYVLGLSGLIVGTPIIAEQLSSESSVVCFDRVCPRCYEDMSITRALTLELNQRATCGKCNRSYNLNNLGISDDGNKLYRYMIRVSGNALVVSNQ